MKDEKKVKIEIDKAINDADICLKYAYVDEEQRDGMVRDSIMYLLENPKESFRSEQTSNALIYAFRDSDGLISIVDAKPIREIWFDGIEKRALNDEK